MIDFFMGKALNLAELAFEHGEIPVGAVIVDNNTNTLIASAFNLVENSHNAIFHAEIIAINDACKILKSKYLVNCSIYCTLEPCTMCAAAISLTKMHSLYYGASDLKQGAIENGVRFFTSSSCFHRPEIYPSIGEKKSSKLIRNFFKKVRDV